MTRKEELVKEYDRLDKELTEVDKNLYSMRWSTPTIESLQELNLLRDRRKQIEISINEIITEIARLLKNE